MMTRSGANCVGNVIGAMCEGVQACHEDLDVREKVDSIRVKLLPFIPDLRLR